MDVEKALRKIKEALQKEIFEARHYKVQCSDRNLDSAKVKEVVRNNKILGIVEQSEGMYKVWFELDKYKDLNIILKLLQDGSIKLITVFPCYSERRRRK